MLMIVVGDVPAVLKNSQYFEPLFLESRLVVEPDYDFTSLSPLDFEILARDLLTKRDKITYSTFRIGPDGGVDIRALVNGEEFIGQCKHQPQAKRSQVLASVRREVKKWSGLKCKRYSYITSADLTPSVAREVERELAALAEEVEVIGRGAINALIANSVGIERKHFKLWLSSSTVLEDILEGGAFIRGAARLERIRRNYERFVHHPQCDEAWNIMQHQGLCVLVGAPGSGKTTVAEYLVLRASREGMRLVADPRSTDRWWNYLEDEQPTIFFFDDAWGQTRFGDSRRDLHADKDLAEFIEDVQGRRERERRLTDRSAHLPMVAKRLVVTSRTQVLGESRAFSDHTNRIKGIIDLARVRIGRFSPEVRKNILLNHVYYSFSPGQRGGIWEQSWWDGVVDHPNYSPRIVEQAVQKALDFPSVAIELKRALDHPMELWGTSFRSLPSFDQSLLINLLLFPAIPIPEREVLATLPEAQPSEYEAALWRLDESWVSRTVAPAVTTLELADPSCRDFLLSVVASSEPLAYSLIERAQNLDQLFQLCGYGEAEEAALQPTLFDIPGQYVLREVLDRCALAVIERLSSTWSDSLNFPYVGWRRPGGESSHPVANLFSNFLAMVRFINDRHRGVRNSGSWNWMGFANHSLEKLHGMSYVDDIEELCDLISDLCKASDDMRYARRQLLLPPRLIEVITEFPIRVWANQSKWFLAPLSPEKDRDPDYEEDPEFTSYDMDHIIETLVKSSERLTQMGIAVTVDVASSYVEEIVDQHLQALYDTHSTEVHEVIFESIENCESLLGMSFSSLQAKWGEICSAPMSVAQQTIL